MKRIIYILPLCVMFASCDIFSTRSPEKPESPRANFQPATTSEILIQNLKDAFKDKVNENYMSCFVDSSFSKRKFFFSPSAGSTLKFQHLNNWTLQAERHYFANLINTISTNSQIVLNFFNEEKNFQGDSTSYTAQYSITVPTEDDQKPKFYQGNLQFTLIRDDRLQWVIAFWQDVKDEKFPSWSELKGLYY